MLIPQEPFARRQFLRLLAATSIGATLAACSKAPAEQAVAPKPAPQIEPPSTGDAYLAVARGDDPTAITMAAVAAVGACSRHLPEPQWNALARDLSADRYLAEAVAEVLRTRDRDGG